MFEIGNSLREARLRRRLDFRELEQATKIRSKYLRALEDEDFDTLPAQTYVRGFLRTYAEYLDLDGGLFVDEYNSRFATGESRPPAGPRRSEGRRRSHGRIETNLVVFVLTAILVLTALVIAAWRFSSSPLEEPGAKPRRTQQLPRSAPAARPTPTVAEPTVERASLVVRAARGNCWLEVHDASRKPWKLLYQGTLEEGQVQRFRTRKIWINAGVPENLAVTLNGRPVSFGSGGKPVVVVVTANSVTPA